MALTMCRPGRHSLVQCCYLMLLCRQRCSCSLFGCADVQHIVASNECVPIAVGQLPVRIFLSLLHCDVHVTINAHEDACSVG